MANDLRHLIPNIMDLSRQIGSNYSHLHGVLKGTIGCSAKLAKRIETATGGVVRAVWLLGLEEPPPLTAALGAMHERLHAQRVKAS